MPKKIFIAVRRTGWGLDLQRDGGDEASDAATRDDDLHVDDTLSS